MLEQIEHRQRCCRHDRRNAVREQVRSRALPQPLDHLAPGGHETTTSTAQGLAEGSVERVSLEVRGRIAEQETRLLGLSPLTDQKLAGVVMMVEQLATVGLAFLLLLRAARRERAQVQGPVAQVPVA